jgi:N-acetylglucosamine-6-phosphate deacetylase
VHLHSATVSLLLRAFGPERVALITDAVRPAGMDAGVFRLGGQEARLESGRVTLPDGTISGSAATMDAVVANVVRWGAATLAEAVRMAATVPASVAGAGSRKGRLAPGYDADIVALGDDLVVKAAWTRGRPSFPS